MIFRLHFVTIRLLRWIILVPLVIYLSLFLIKYKRTLPLKSASSLPKDESPVVENLSFDVDGITVTEKIEIRQDYGEVVMINRRGAEAIRGVDGIENEDNNPRSLLEDIFWRADANGNQLLDIQELAKWIHGKITEHINKAMRDNIGLFTAIDNDPRNGEVSWDEYHAHFLRSHGLSDKYIASHDKRHGALSRSLKETIMRDRARWAEAARTDPERLALDEFLAFTHPESSHRALLQIVEELFEKFDRDGDEQLTEDEFSSLPSEGVGLELAEDRNRPVPGSEERRKEFRHLIDKNKDGKADRTELLMYIDPRNPRHAIQEAQYLIDLSDTNHDGRLSLPEVLSKMELFLGSKMIDTEKSFHDEF
ncbi:45 kDa calcium-binding protein [Orussus abietinus]|uniref:45 kDa calcium-binding protein n=1 Tax=Orussus abietinus TaxID=222816 RepID=UPI000625C1A0|nr:45 kDa calcium-binding protein [Orussus abietinus]